LEDVDHDSVIEARSEDLGVLAIDFPRNLLYLNHWRDSLDAHIRQKLCVIHHHE
jgi:hypothetical protein